MFTVLGKIAMAATSAAVALVIGGGALLVPLALNFGLDAGEFYTQIDNDSLTIGPSHDDMDCEYRLPAYNAQGDRIDATFGAYRPLREDAYLKLEVRPFRGVISWEEVQPENVPFQAQTRLGLSK